MTQGLIWRLKCDRCEECIEKNYDDHMRGSVIPVPADWSETVIKVVGKEPKRIWLCPICSEFLDLFFPDTGEPVPRYYDYDDTGLVGAPRPMTATEIELRKKQFLDLVGKDLKPKSVQQGPTAESIYRGTITK